MGTLNAMGVNVLDLGLSTTPTVELAVPAESAAGGIILTASHNPKQWNALKLLGPSGEFLNAAEGDRVLVLSSEKTTYADIKDLGYTEHLAGWLETHVDHALDLELVDAAAIKAKGLKIAVDAVNSTGGIIMPMLLEALGCEVVEVNCDPTGHFAHNPEPLPAHLEELSRIVVEEQCDLGISVDPASYTHLRAHETS